MKQFVLGPNEENLRLFKVLQKLMPHAPQSMIHKSLRKKCVKVNQKRITDGNLVVHQGDVLQLYVNEEFLAKEKDAPFWATLSPKVQVVYEDDHVLVMNKPWGLLSQSETEPSLEGHMRAYLLRKGAFDLETEHTFLPSLCHRIDRNTDGLVIGAKDAQSLRVLNEKIKNREIRKFYLLEVEGCPKEKEGEIRGFLKKDEKSRKMVFYEKETHDAVFCHTRYRVLKSGKTSQIEAELLTGKTHQIRAGFAAMGHPLVGDTKYGAAAHSERHQHLTAWRIEMDFTQDAGHLAYLNGKSWCL